MFYTYIYVLTILVNGIYRAAVLVVAFVVVVVVEIIFDSYKLVYKWRKILGKCMTFGAGLRLYPLLLPLHLDYDGAGVPGLSRQPTSPRMTRLLPILTVRLC